jgi:hypothetical protein
MTCPGSRPSSFAPPAGEGAGPSRLAQWPVQLHLLPPAAPFLSGKELLLAADCVPFACGDFHERLLSGKALAVACPKLDHDQERYVEKLAAMADEGGIASMTVAIMQVPCCRGLAALAGRALARAARKVPARVVILSLSGEVIAEQPLAG